MISLLTFISIYCSVLLPTDICQNNAVHQGNELGARITLMYRRSGQTAKSYSKVNHQDTLHFYRRGENPYFRVYTFQFNRRDIRVNQMVVESYSNDRLVKKVETRLRPAGNQRFQGVDTYVDPEEDLVKVTLKCRPVSSAGINEFVFFIVPDE